MRAQLSVVIPTLNAAADLPKCLLSLMEGVEVGMIREVVISDGGSTDATSRIADAAGAVWLGGAASRGAQLRRGVAEASGSWLMILHADCVLSPGWVEMVQAQIARENPAYFRLRFDAQGFAPAWVAGWANLRARLLRLPYGDQGLLISRSRYDAVGGYADIPLMEDVVMARALRGRLYGWIMPSSPVPPNFSATAGYGAARVISCC